MISALNFAQKFGNRQATNARNTKFSRPDEAHTKEQQRLEKEHRELVREKMLEETKKSVDRQEHVKSFLEKTDKDSRSVSDGNRKGWSTFAKKRAAGASPSCQNCIVTCQIRTDSSDQCASMQQAYLVSFIRS